MKSTAHASKETEKKEDETAVRKIVMGIVRKVGSGDIDLPVLPKVVHEIQGVINQPNSTISDLARVIERDAAISIRLISVANSPLYRGAEKIYAVSRAIHRMGTKETRSIITAIANKSLYETKHKQFRMLMERLWLHSLACAYGSRSIAERLGVGDVEKLFLMGLLHDIGKPLLLKILTDTVPHSESSNMDQVVASIQEVHSSFGGVVLDRWGFSQEFKRIAIRHEGPKFHPATDKAILIVNVANILVRRIGYSLIDDNVEPSEAESVKLLELDSMELVPICEVIEERMEDTAHIF
jgi:putative nucleotidyltransferase with HDIG domain